MKTHLFLLMSAMSNCCLIFQLTCLISLLTSLIIFAPNISEDAITNFFANRTMLMIEKKRESSRKLVQIGNLCQLDVNLKKIFLIFLKRQI